MSINYNPNHMYKSGFINACFNPYYALNIINNIAAKSHLLQEFLSTPCKRREGT